MCRFFLIFCTVLSAAAPGFAHEGHGHPEHTNGLLHYLVNPSHAVTALLVGAVIIMGLKLGRMVMTRDRRE